MSDNLTREQLQEKSLFELRGIARGVKVISPTKYGKDDLILKILETSEGSVRANDNRTHRTPIRPSKLVYSAHNADKPVVSRQQSGDSVISSDKAAEPISDLITMDETCEEREGILDIHTDGYGFIRVRNCEHSDKDVYVSAIKIRKSGLRRGDYIKGIVKVAYDNKPAALLIINTINGVPAEQVGRRPNFDELVPIYPESRIKLENARSKFDYAIRAIDLTAPIGKGQRDRKSTRLNSSHL